MNWFELKREFDKKHLRPVEKVEDLRIDREVRRRIEVTRGLAPGDIEEGLDSVSSYSYRGGFRA